MIANRKKQVVTTAAARSISPPKKASHLALVPSTARVMGYARVSTEDQNLGVQITALKGSGCDKIYVEKISAVNAKRPQFDLMMKIAERGDTILFHSLSRMGRQASRVIDMLQGLTADGVAWRSLTEPHLDATTAIGRFMVTLTGAKDQLERDQIIERTKRGMDECRRKGMWLGRKPKVSDADARKMLAMRKKGMTAEQIARRFRRLKIQPSTVYSRTNKLMKKRK